MLKERVTDLRGIRDQARADAERAEHHTPQALETFARGAAKACGPRAGATVATISALAQRVEVDTKEVRIMGSKSALLADVVAGRAQNRQVLQCPVLVPKWLPGPDSNQRPTG